MFLFRETSIKKSTAITNEKTATIATKAVKITTVGITKAKITTVEITKVKITTIAITTVKTITVAITIIPITMIATTTAETTTIAIIMIAITTVAAEIDFVQLFDLKSTLIENKASPIRTILYVNALITSSVFLISPNLGNIYLIGNSCSSLERAAMASSTNI